MTDPRSPEELAGLVRRARERYLAVSASDPWDETGKVSEVRDLYYRILSATDRYNAGISSRPLPAPPNGGSVPDPSRLKVLIEKVADALPIPRGPQEPPWWTEPVEADAAMRWRQQRFVARHLEEGKDALYAHLGSILPQWPGETAKEHRHRLEAWRRGWRPGRAREVVEAAIARADRAEAGIESLIRSGVGAGPASAPPVPARLPSPAKRQTYSGTKAPTPTYEEPPLASPSRRRQRRRRGAGARRAVR